MIVMKPTLFQLLQLCAQARPDEIEQHEAIVGRTWDIDEVANDHFSRPGVKLALVHDDGTPLAAAGWDPVIDGVWHGWMVGTMDAWERHWFPITKTCRKVMDKMLADGARRLQFSALASREKTCDWYSRGLRMQREGVMRGYGFNGEDAVMYARVKETGHG